MASAGVRTAVPVRRLWGAALCGYLALGATLQELPGYVVERFAGGPAIAGLVVGVAFAATAVGRPFAGLAGDAGWSRPVVVLGAALTTVAALGHLLAPSVWVLLVARLAMGAGEAALFSSALPWVLAGTSAARRGRVAGWFGLSMWGGLALGPLVAVLAHRLGGYSATWWTVAALPLVSTVLVVSTRAPRPVARPTRLRSWRDIVPRGAGLPGLCIGLAAYGYGTMTALVVLYLTDARLGGESVALAVFAAAFLLARSGGSPLIDRYGGAPVLVLVLGVEVGGLLVLAAAGAKWIAVLATALIGAGLSLVYPATTAMTLHRTEARSPGLAVGAMTSMWDLGILAAGPLGGLIAAHLGYRQAFVVAAAVTAVAVLVVIALLRQGTSQGSAAVAGG